MLKCSAPCPDTQNTTRGRWRALLSRLLIICSGLESTPLESISLPPPPLLAERLRSIGTSRPHDTRLSSSVHQWRVSDDAEGALLLFPIKRQHHFHTPTRETAEKDPQLRSEEQFAGDIIRYNHALMSCVQPHAVQVCRVFCLFCLFLVPTRYHSSPSSAQLGAAMFQASKSISRLLGDKKERGITWSLGGAL